MPLPLRHPFRFASPASGNRRIITPGTSASCTLSALSASGGTISWAQATNAAGYQWYVGTASGSGTISYGTVSGGSTVTTNFTVSLTASTNYYGWVRAYSSTGDFGAYTYSAAATWTAGAGLYAFSTITFTNAGYTGMAGPILSACVSAYQASNPWVTNTAYFKMSSYQGYQQWTVPSTAPYTFVVAGAGSAGSGYGYGAVLTSTISLTQGHVINICVGQQGLSGSASGCGNGWGGSGGTFVVNSTTSTPLIIAGGGGGTTVYNTTTANINASLTTSGKQDGSNHGTAGSGGSGGQGGYGCCCQGGGGGGYSGTGFSYSAGGGNGYHNGLVVNGASPWGNNGGFGGGGGGFYAGGGGGGYSGGAGGGLNSCSCADCQGGGGGGSYSSATITSSSVNRNGMGYVQVTINAFGPPQTVTVSSADTFLKTSAVTWTSVYQAVSYTVTLYQNASNSTTGGTSLGSTTTANTTYTFTNITFTTGYYAYATVYATNATPTNTAATASTTTLIVALAPANLVVTTTLSTQTAVGNWSFVDHAYITSYTVSLYTNTTNSTSGATLVASPTTANLTYTFTGLSLVLNNYAYITVSATGAASSTTATVSPIVQIQNELYAFTSHTFTPAGVTGRTGPNLGQIQSAYSAAAWASNTSYLNMTTTGYQLWTVPSSRTYTIRCAGAATAQVTSGYGYGVVIETTVSLTQGQVIQILVGQKGGTYSNQSTGGGGGSFVASGSTPITGVCIIAAGGGGGHIYQTSTGGGTDQNGTTSTSGKNSSDLYGYGGSGGGGGTGACCGGWGGGGGGFTGNGTDGASSPNTRGFSFINGGAGGAYSQCCALGGFGGGGGTHGNTGGGGGGGGYSGGGGSGQDNNNTTGGGGGSFPAGASYIALNSGDGYVTIS